MSESLPEPTRQESLHQAQQRLAARFGGQWALQSDPIEISQIQPGAEGAEVIGQRSIAEADQQTKQRLVELGMLASGTPRKPNHYFAR